MARSRRYLDLEPQSSAQYFDVFCAGAAEYIASSYGAHHSRGGKTGAIIQDIMHTLTGFIPLSADYATVSDTTLVGGANVSGNYPAEIDDGDIELDYFDSALIFDDFSAQALDETIEAVCAMEFGYFYAEPTGAFRYMERSQYLKARPSTPIPTEAISAQSLTIIPDRFSYVQIKSQAEIEFEELPVFTFHFLPVLPGVRRIEFTPSLSGSTILDLETVQFVYPRGESNDDIGLTYIFDGGHYMQILSNRQTATTIPEITVLATGNARAGAITLERHTQQRGGRTLFINTSGVRLQDADSILDFYSKFYGQDQSLIANISIDTHSTSLERQQLWLLDRINVEAFPGYVREYSIIGLAKAWSPANGQLYTTLYLDPYHFYATNLVGSTTVGESTIIGL